MKEKFMEFLKQNNALEIYVQNAANDHHALIEGIMKRHKPHRWIQAGFDWANTQQGQDYWYNLHNQWQAILNQH